MKTFTKSLIAASIAIITGSTFADNHIYQLDEYGHIKKDFALIQEAGPVIVNKNVVKPVLYSGQEAIDELGSEFDSFAESLSYEPAYLKHQFLIDPTLKLTADHQIVVIEAPEQAILTSDKTVPPIPSAPFEGDAFKLHSKPGAKKTIYLDFNGHTTTGNTSIWGDFNAIAYSLDGDAATFSIREHNEIYAIWASVAEDYKIFDVDVTTEEPVIDNIWKSSINDDTYGMRVIITASSVNDIPYLAGQNQMGGVAFIGSFRGASPKPDFSRSCFVFSSRGLSNSSKAIAEASSHEAGHTFNLLHHGYIQYDNQYAYYTGHGHGETGWAPIMGVGYWKNLVQWSNGSYPTANNSQQDDIAIIKNTLAPEIDDFADTKDLATTLLVDSISFETNNSVVQIATKVQTTYGVINKNDVDLFKFETSNSGPATFTITTPSVYNGTANDGNLDAMLTIYDANNNVVVSDDTSYKVSSTVSTNLPAGVYYLEVKPSYKPNEYYTPGYPVYGSVGQYVLTGKYITNTNPEPPVAVITKQAETGNVPLSINFSSNDSLTGYGSIDSYYWDFGDGFTSTESNPVHTFKAVGTFTTKLTITNTAGITNSITTNITVNSIGGPEFHVKKVKIGTKTIQGKNKAFTATVTLNTNLKKVMPNAKVYGIFSGSVKQCKTCEPYELFETEVNATSAKNGNALLMSNTYFIGAGYTVTFRVTKIVSPTDVIVYDSTKNLMNSGSVIKK